MSNIEPYKLKQSVVALEVDGELSYDEWQEIGEQIAVMHAATPWWIGDWYNLGESRYGEQAASAQIIADTSTANGRKLSPDTVQSYAYVCARYPIKERHENLSFRHHRVVASSDNRKELLTQAEAHGLASTDLAKKAKEPQAVKVKHRPDLLMTFLDYTIDQRNLLQEKGIELRQGSVLVMVTPPDMIDVSIRLFRSWGVEFSFQAIRKKTIPGGESYEALLTGIVGGGMSTDAEVKLIFDAGKSVEDDCYGYSNRIKEYGGKLVVGRRARKGWEEA